MKWDRGITQCDALGDHYSCTQIERSIIVSEMTKHYAGSTGHNNNSNNNHDDIYSAVIHGAIHMREFTSLEENAGFALERRLSAYFSSVNEYFRRTIE